MKKKYIQPSSEVICVRLLGSLLGGEPMHGPTVVTDHVDAKESGLVEEEEVLPAQPSLWGDDEE